MKIRLEQTRAIFLQNARAARVDPSKEVRLGIYAAHYTIMENAADMCRLAVPAAASRCSRVCRWSACTGIRAAAR